MLWSVVVSAGVTPTVRVDGASVPVLETQLLIEKIAISVRAMPRAMTTSASAWRESLSQSTMPPIRPPSDPRRSRSALERLRRLRRSMLGRSMLAMLWEDLLPRSDDAASKGSTSSSKERSSWYWLLETPRVRMSSR